jgi:hypothetical protein
VEASPSDKPRGGVDLEQLVERRLAQIGVDKQHPALIRLAQRERQVHRGERLPLARHGAGDHHHGQTALGLGVVQDGRQLPVLLARHLGHLVVGHHLLGQTGVDALEEPPAAWSRRFGGLVCRGLLTGRGLVDRGSRAIGSAFARLHWKRFPRKCGRLGGRTGLPSVFPGHDSRCLLVGCPPQGFVDPAHSCLMKLNNEERRVFEYRPLKIPAPA